MLNLKSEINSSKNYFVWTIGCQMNIADSQKLENVFDNMGLGKSDSVQDANVVVLNSCVVRKSAESKVESMLGTLKSVKTLFPEKIFVLMGCMVGPKTDDLKKRFPYVDVFAQPQKIEPIVDFISNKMGIDSEGCLESITVTPDVAAYVPIIHGCDKFCSFCIIPYRRGREVSRTIEDIVNEVELLTFRGVQEVTLLGQNVDSYGHDLQPGNRLEDLLSAVNDVEGIKRIRFLTSHPNDMSEQIIKAVLKLDKVCENFLLPFQAGDDDVLNSMRRGYTNLEYRNLVDKIRDYVPQATIATDIIVGFCGETEAQFQETLDLIQEIRFDKVHAAAYSPRKGTISDRMMEDSVSKEEKKERLEAIWEMQESVQVEINKKLIGQELEVLVEGKKRNKVFGRTRNDKLVFIDTDYDKTNEFVCVKIDDSTAWSLQGTISR
ncbi:MAG: tRNA (N6-isopentenyl adenosine(37)-C2)-methylthiotransferase MiaB [Chloroflexi bacterium]|nr:tRNA (N6-isopentenyl adenosine(37)-C2)-methylthiotransferase MiaB [Chloroflexota bacterium]|tara:strand:- start:29679 stop:30983 length:1305 start_codon:yes stop_codon:yes gene_type:complete